MDDDLTFGTSVWGTSDTFDLGPPQTKPSHPSFDHQFDDQFDDFSDLTDSTHHINAAEDDFGDFEDFEEPTNEGQLAFEEFGAGSQISEPSQWLPLRLAPLPSRLELTQQLNTILQPLWPLEDPWNIFTNENIREAEGVNQILATPESRDLYKNLVQALPSTKPPNWTRSRIRRQHLIALGIPVNLDEVLPRGTGKPLPPLQISMRPMSAPPVARHAFPPNNVPASSHPSRTGTPQPNPPYFGPKPELDHAKIQKLLELDTDTLALEPISSLERHLAELREQTALMSSLLTHLLQIRETLQQDSETYNGLIADLVGEAQKMKSGKLKGGSGRRASQMT